MTVNQLYEAWMFNGKPHTELEIWDRSECDYVVKINFDKPQKLSNKKIKQIENTTVGRFTTFFNNKNNVHTLSINVDKLGE